MTRLMLAGTLAAVTGLLCVLLLIGLEAPWTGLAHGVAMAMALPVPDVWGADYDLHLAEASEQGDGRKRLASLKSAEGGVKAELAASPLRPEAWLRLAYIRALERRGFTPDVLAPLAQSYQAAPVDAQSGAWRIHFGLSAWSALNPVVRREVIDELSALWVAAPAAQPTLRDAVSTTVDPAGRVAGEAAIAALQARKS